MYRSCSKIKAVWIFLSKRTFTLFCSQFKIAMKTETSPGNYHLPTHFSPWTQCIPVIWKERHLEIRNYSSTLRIKSPETQKKCLIVKLCDDQSCEQQKLFTFQTGLWHSKVWGMAGIINHFGTITFTSLLILKMEKSGCFPIKPDTIPQHHCLAKPRLYQPVDTVVWCLQAPGNLFFLFHITLCPQTDQVQVRDQLEDWMDPKHSRSQILTGP